MAVTPLSLSYHPLPLLCLSSSPMHYYISQLHDESMLPLLLIAVFSMFFFSLLSLFLYRRHRRRPHHQTQIPNPNPNPIPTQNAISVFRRELPKTVYNTHKSFVSNLTNMTKSLLLEILLSSSRKCELFEKPNSAFVEEMGNSGANDRNGNKKKKKKKKAKKKAVNLTRLDESNSVENRGELDPNFKPELGCLYPFTSSSSVMQRKIKHQYDQLMKCHESKGLTMAQVCQFSNCLIEARSELLHKSEVIQRKFTITNALLCKADRSSFDRLRQQVCKLELEQKRLEEDALVYNWLQQQLKLSPAYKKMLEIGPNIELEAKSDDASNSMENDFTNISFEEFLAQEKKDSFWQRNGKLRSSSG